ncbi:hypothetical protein LTR66_010198 [Elasticomyces elasticus]|nr:hypothetical protein LTR28_012741 [Elasticomyces elasticus]KAK4981125.1 hypothetical protein LTR66_010198 [Elasticomyces elasticus]
MDPLSIAASTSALLAITNGVVGWGVSAFKAKEERLELYNRVQGVEPILNLILKRQKDAAKYPDERWWDGLEALSPDSNPPGPLSRLDSLVREAAIELRPSTGVRQLMHSALHFWTKETYRAKIADISNYCAHIGLIVQNAHVDISVSNNRQGKQTYARVGEVQVTIESLADEVKLLKLDAYRQREEQCQAEWREIAYWLSRLTHLKRQDFSKAPMRMFIIPFWFLRTEDLRQWTDGKPRQSRCYGYGGAGKTTAASVVADHLQKKPDPGSSQTLHIYLDYDDKQNLTLPIFLGSQIRQLLSLDVSHAVPDGVRDIYASWRWRDSRPDARILLDIFEELIKVYRECCLLLDTGEECPKQVRWNLEERLRDLQQTGNLSMMTTARPLGAEERLVEIYERVEFTIRTPGISIEQYVRDELKNEIRDTKAGQNDWRITQRVDATRLGEHIMAKPSLAEVVLQAIVAKADGIFI